MRIVDMLPANGGSRGGNSLIGDRQHLHNLIAIERVTDADAPGITIFLSRYLDVAASIDVEIGPSGFFEQMRGLKDGPTLDDARGINQTVMPDVEIPIRFLSGLLA